MSSMIAVSIDYINGKPTTSKVECICGTRNLRIRNVALVNDIVTLKILNHLNGTIHAGISEPNLGILFTKCRKCGGKVVPMRDAIKCTDCAWIDERKLSSNFGNSDFVNLRDKQMIRVSFQGERGAYSEAAARSFFSKKIETIPFPTFAEVLESTT